ncbi:MAG: ATP-binding protein [Flavobacteriales bacterium]|jgi:Na+/proline symporter/nitrogen-specific signal transduction histidine kinase|nr:ATP-binding protein [Flavobacteriales bacterium]
MSSTTVILIILAYLAFTFFIAFWAEKNKKSRWVNHPYTYAISLAVYCTAWTYYGSVGMAKNSGISFLTIYIGPIIIIPAWIMIMKKVIRISKGNKVASLADFISIRYGNNRFLGALVTIICLLAIVPYIALQLKAISESFSVITEQSLSKNLLSDTTFYIALILGVFAAIFSTRNTDASEKHPGIIATIAVEAIIKLVVFLLLGFYIIYGVFDHPVDLINQAKEIDGFEKTITLSDPKQYFDWLLLSMLSMFAIFLLPRQFQTTVVENERIKHLNKALWIFPLYLLLFNLFVAFIAWGGSVLFENTDANPDVYSLMIPMLFNNDIMAILVFVGGFSAAISMILISSLSLSTMLSNNLIIPYGFLKTFVKGESETNEIYIKNIRRISIFSLILLAFFFYHGFAMEKSLYSLGLIAFVMIAQLAPAFFGGLYWKRGLSIGATSGIIVGFFFTLILLIIPYSLTQNTENTSLIAQGYFGITWLKPYQFLGLDYLSPVPQAFFWSIFFNLGTYLVVSVSTKGTYRERNYAEIFVDSNTFLQMHETAFVWKGEAYVKDLKSVLNRFLGSARTERALNLFYLKYNFPKNEKIADARLINFSERLLTGSIGSASARILISSVIKEDKISLPEVLEVLEDIKEAKASNKALEIQSKELKKLANKVRNNNIELREKDKQKDEFLDTVSHELKTPITSIKALSEILIDNQEIDQETRIKFIQSIAIESDRVAKLVNHLLDIEKLTNGREILAFQLISLSQVIKDAIQTVSHLSKKKNIAIHFMDSNTHYIKLDMDRIHQVFVNILSNALKFCPENNGKITISIQDINNAYLLSFTDNGKGVEETELTKIFEKFYQSENQNRLKPTGSGLGLAISKQIIESHQGSIWAENNKHQGLTIFIKLYKAKI